MTPDRCLLCGGQENNVLVRYSEPDAYERAAGVEPAGYRREWVACGGCRLHYSRYSRDPDALDRLYETAYRDTSAAWRSEPAEDVFRRVSALPPAESETQARLSWITRRLSARPGPDSRKPRLLDVGGATGLLAHAFRESGWAVHVVDPGAQGRFIERYGVSYHQMPYGQRPLGEERFDLITMVFVLEHVRDPGCLLRSAHDDLAPGGLLYVEVPDVAAFDHKPAEDDIFNACHLWMFGPETLARLLDDCGFGIVAIERTRTLRGHYALMALAEPRA